MNRAPPGEISRRRPLGEITMVQADTTENHQELYKQQQRHPHQALQQQQQQQQHEQPEYNQSGNEQDHPQQGQPYSLTHGNPPSPSREEFSCTSDEEESRHRHHGRQHILRSRLQEPEPKSREHYPEWCGPQGRGSRYLFSMIHRSQRIDLEREVSSAEELFETRPRLLWSESYDPNLSPDISDWYDEPTLQPWPGKAAVAERDNESDNAQQHHANSSKEFDTKDRKDPPAQMATSSTQSSIPTLAVEVKASIERKFEDFEEPGVEADDEREDNDEGPLRKRRRTSERSKGSPPTTSRPIPRSKESAASDEGYFDIIAASRLPYAKNLSEAGPSSAGMISNPVAVFHVRSDITPEIEKALQPLGASVENSLPSEKDVDSKDIMDKNNESPSEFNVAGIRIGDDKPDKNISDVHVQPPQSESEASQAGLEKQFSVSSSGLEVQTGGDGSFEPEDVDYEDDAGGDLSAYYDGDTKLSAVLHDEDEFDKESYELVDEEDDSPDGNDQPSDEPVEGRAGAIKDEDGSKQEHISTLHPPVLEEDEESDKENQEPTYATDEQQHEVVQESDDERDSIESEVFIVGDDESEGPSDKVDEADVSNSKYPLYFDDSGFGHSECFDGACSPSGLVLEAESSVHESFYRSGTPCTPQSRIGSRYSDAGLDAELFEGTPRSDYGEHGRYGDLSTPRNRVFVSNPVSENEAERDDDVTSTLGERTPPRKAERLLYSDCPPTISRGYTCEALLSIQEERLDSSQPNLFSNDKAISSRTASYQLKDGDNSEDDNEGDLVSPFMVNRRLSSEHGLNRKSSGAAKGTIVLESGTLFPKDKGHKHPRELECGTTTNGESRRDDKRYRVELAQPIITLPVPVGSVCDRGEIITPAVMQVYKPRRLDFSQPRAQPPLLRPFAGPLADARGWKAHQESVTTAANTTNTSTADTTAATATTSTTTNDAAWRICKVRVKTTLSAAELALQRK